MKSNAFSKSINSIRPETLADFKYVVTFNSHGNANGSVYPSPSTQCKMLTSRPTQMLGMVLHSFNMRVLLSQTMADFKYGVTYNTHGNTN